MSQNASSCLCFWFYFVTYQLAGAGTAEESQGRVESTCGQVCNRILHCVDDELSTAMMCFHRFDTDSDGSIDQHELELAMRELGLVLSKKELSHVMQEIDLDGDGQIAAGEFLDRLNLARHDLQAQRHRCEPEPELVRRLSSGDSAASDEAKLRAELDEGFAQVGRMKRDVAKAKAAATRSLKTAPASARDNRAAVMVAVSQNGLDLQYASKALREDPEVVLTAAAQSPGGAVLRYASRELQEDEGFMEAAAEPWLALEELRGEELRQRAAEVGQLRRQLRAAEGNRPRSNGGSSPSISRQVKRQMQTAERVTAGKLADEVSKREAAEYRATALERKLKAITEKVAAEAAEQDAAQGSEKLQHQLADAEIRLRTNEVATKHARKAMVATAQSAEKVRKELALAVESTALMQAQLSEAQQKLCASQKELRRAKNTLTTRTAEFVEDLAAKSKLVETMHQEPRPEEALEEKLRVTLEQGRAEVQIQWVGSLHRAIEADDLSTMRTLLNAGRGSRAAITARVEGTMSPMPLHRAIRKGNLEVVSRLMAEYTRTELRAVLSLLDPFSGYSALHMAVEYGHAHITDAIIEAGCNTTLLNKRGDTAWDLAKLLAGHGVACVDSVFHSHATSLGGHTTLALELDRQRDRSETLQMHCDDIEIDTRRLHTFSLDTLENWGALQVLGPAEPFGWQAVVESIFPRLQIGRSFHQKMMLFVAKKPGAESEDLYSEVKRLAQLTRNQECPENVLQVLGIVHGRAGLTSEMIGLETWMMATEWCDTTLASVVYESGGRDGPGRYYSREFVLEQSQGVAWGMAYLHDRGVLHLQLSLGCIALKQIGGTSEEPVYTPKIAGLINQAKFNGNGLSLPLHGTVSVTDTADPIYGTPDVVAFGSMLTAMLSRKQESANPVRELILMEAADLPPLCQLLAEACCSKDMVDRPTFEQIHRLFYHIEAKFWLAPTASADLSQTAVAEGTPPEPTPTRRLIRMLSDHLLGELSQRDYPYEMELLKRQLETVRLASEQKLRAQLEGERMLSQENRDRAVGAAISGLTQVIQAKEQEIEVVRQYGNGCIDLLKAKILEMGKFSESEIALSIVETRSALQGDNTDTLVRTLQRAADSADSATLLREGQAMMSSLLPEMASINAAYHSPEQARVPVPAAEPPPLTPTPARSNSRTPARSPTRSISRASVSSAARSRSSKQRRAGGDESVFERLYNQQSSSRREKAARGQASSPARNEPRAHVAWAPGGSKSPSATPTRMSRHRPPSQRRPSSRERTRALVDTLRMQSDVALHLSPAERRSCERSAILNSLQEAMAAKRHVFGSSMDDPAHVFAAIGGSGSVSPDEIFEALRRLGLGLSQDQLERLLAFIDVDGDGQVDYAELLSFLREDDGQDDLLYGRDQELPHADISPLGRGQRSPFTEEEGDHEDLFLPADEMAAGSVLTVVCPEGCNEGDTITVDTDDAEIDIVIPAGVVPGDEFDIEL